MAIATYEERGARLQQEHEQLVAAKEALALDTAHPDLLSGPLSELAGLKEAWQAVHSCWQSLATIKETPWQSVIPRKVRPLDGCACSTPRRTRAP